MTHSIELELLDEAQNQAELLADQERALRSRSTRVRLPVADGGRRHNLWIRRARLTPRTPTTAAARLRNRRPCPPLGNGEPCVLDSSSRIRRAPGALMEELVRKHGAAAFQRATFTCRSGRARCLTIPRRLRTTCALGYQLLLRIGRSRPRSSTRILPRSASSASTRRSSVP
jgi:hypothetical protein